MQVVEEHATAISMRVRNPTFGSLILPAYHEEKPNRDHTGEAQPKLPQNVSLDQSDLNQPHDQWQCTYRKTNKKLKYLMLINY